MSDTRYTFAAVKSEKGLVIQARPYFDRVVSTFGDGERFVVTVEPFREKRSNRANRALWGPVYDSLMLQIADAVGYDRHERAAAKELIHEGLCAKYGGMTECPVTKQPVRKFRTSKATVKEFSDYIEWVARYAAQEWGIVVELPGEVA